MVKSIQISFQKNKKAANCLSWTKNTPKQSNKPNWESKTKLRKAGGARVRKKTGQVHGLWPILAVVKRRHNRSQQLHFKYLHYLLLNEGGVRRRRIKEDILQQGERYRHLVFLFLFQYKTESFLLKMFVCCKVKTRSINSLGSSPNKREAKCLDERIENDTFPHFIWIKKWFRW